MSPSVRLPRDEQTSRALKAVKLLGLIRPSRDAEDSDAIANGLAIMDKPSRDAFARAAGVESPSLITWAVVVEGVRARKEFCK